MQIEKLEQFNKELLDTYNPKRLLGSVNCVMPGYFKGNDFLFIAQNPGELKADVEGDVLYMQSYEKKEYDKIREYYIQALKSSRGTYGTFINDVYGEDWSAISFTNVFKCPFVGNVIPKKVPDFELSVLRTQIKLLAPKYTIVVGSIARDSLERLGIFALPFRHPSYLKRIDLYDKSIRIYKQELEGLKAKSY